MRQTHRGGGVTTLACITPSSKAESPSVRHYTLQTSPHSADLFAKDCQPEEPCRRSAGQAGYKVLKNSRAYTQPAGLGSSNFFPPRERLQPRLPSHLFGAGAAQGLTGRVFLAVSCSYWHRLVCAQTNLAVDGKAVSFSITSAHCKPLAVCGCHILHQMMQCMLC